MLEFSHPCNLLCARLFAGLVCGNGLPSCAGFLVAARQASFVRARMALEAAPFSLSPSPSLFLWLPAFWNECHFLMSWYIHEIDFFV